MVTRALRKVQFGQESQWGTGVAATAKLRGVTDAEFHHVNNVEVRREIGRVVPSENALLMAQEVAGSIGGDVSFEDILYFLHSIFGPGAVTGAGPYVWKYAAPVLVVVTPDLFTVEYGEEGVAEYEVDGALCRSLTINGEPGGLWTFASEWVGKKLIAASMTALGERTIELVRMADTVLAIDAWGGTIGATTVPDMISFSLSIESGTHTKTFAGDVNPLGHGQNEWVVTLRVVLEYSAAVKTIHDSQEGAMMQRLIRIIATSGTNVIQIDFAGTLVNDPELFGDRDGNGTVELEFQGGYNTTLADALKFDITNDVSALV